MLRGAHRRYVARCDQLPVRVRLGLGGRELRAADVHQRSHVFQWRSVHVSYNERVKVTRDKVTRVEVAHVKVTRDKVTHGKVTQVEVARVKVIRVI